MLFGFCYYLTVPVLAEAFKYESWESGMSLIEVEQIANVKQIKYKKQYVKADAVLNMFYIDRVYGGAAQVILSFTPITSKLCTILIRWKKIDFEFWQKTISILTKKYGTISESRDAPTKLLVWRPDNDTMIMFYEQQPQTCLAYLDDPLMKVWSKERSLISGEAKGK